MIRSLQVELLEKTVTRNQFAAHIGYIRRATLVTFQ